MADPTADQIQLLQAIDTHKVGPFPTVSKEEVGECVEKGWLVESDNGYLLTDAGRSVLEANR